MKTRILFLMIFLFLISCQKEEVNLPDPPTDEIPDDEIPKEQTVFAIDQEIMEHFVHHYQYEDSLLVVARSTCVAVSYFMAVNALKASVGLEALFSSDILSQTIDVIGAPSNTMKLHTYIHDFDENVISKRLYTPDKREVMNFIKDAFDLNEFVLVTLNINNVPYSTIRKSDSELRYGKTDDNPDLSPDKEDNEIYITSRYRVDQNCSDLGEVWAGTAVHMVCLVSLEDSDDDGIIGYVDPVSKTKTGSNIKYVSMQRLLSSMAASNCSYMAAISIGLK